MAPFPTRILPVFFAASRRGTSFARKKNMPPVLTDAFRPRRPAWQAAADFAVSVLLVLAIGLVTSLA